MLFRSELFHRLGEHLLVKSHWVRTSEKYPPLPVLRLFVRIVQEMLLELRVLHDKLEAVPPLNHLLSPRHFVKLRICRCVRVLLD